MIFDKFRKKKEDTILPVPMEQAELPEDLERFRMKPPESARMSEPTPTETRMDYPELSYGKSVEDLVSARTSGDKVELILQKLETIDARLRLIEEKIKRY
jgi:hypothetical protein